MFFKQPYFCKNRPSKMIFDLLKQYKLRVSNTFLNSPVDAFPYHNIPVVVGPQKKYHYTSTFF